MIVNSKNRSYKDSVFKYSMHILHTVYQFTYPSVYEQQLRGAKF